MKKYFLLVLLGLSFLSFSGSALAKNVELTGPRGNTTKDTPKAYGFWSFAIPVKNVLSRSGQPTIDEFKWLKKQGYKSVINLRTDNEYKEIANDEKLPGFKDLNFNYLWLPIRDGAAPSNKQAETFLNFVQDKNNQPIHIHCRGGYGRTGTLISLYRYDIQNWTMSNAIKESRLFNGGISSAQEKWLLKWAKNHPKK